MLNPNVLRPKSRGWIKLKSTDPYDPPLINPKYLSDPNDEDIKVCKITINLNSTSFYNNSLYRVYT